jgi:hypothetical protein
LKAILIGAASDAVTFGIGSGAEKLFTNFFSKAAFQAAAHGTFQGSMTAISGGKFWSGFAAGALSSIASSAWGGGTTETEGFSAKNNWAFGAKTIHHAGLGAGTGTVGMIAFGTVAGGAGAALTGGNFWQGALSGLVVSGLNHAGHLMEGEDIDPPGKKSKNQVRKETVKPSFAKFVEVEGNAIGTIDLAHSSKAASWVRGGAPKLAFVSKLLKVTGNTLGAVGAGLEYMDYRNGSMSGFEFSVDTAFAIAPMIFPALAPVSLGYFAGKAIYEYSSGNTMFTKPK